MESSTPLCNFFERSNLHPSTPGCRCHTMPAQHSEGCSCFLAAHSVQQCMPAQGPHKVYSRASTWLLSTSSSRPPSEPAMPWCVGHSTAQLGTSLATCQHNQHGAVHASTPLNAIASCTQCLLLSWFPAELTPSTRPHARQARQHQWHPSGQSTPQRKAAQAQSHATLQAGRRVQSGSLSGGRAPTQQTKQQQAAQQGTRRRQAQQLQRSMVRAWRSSQLQCPTRGPWRPSTSTQVRPGTCS